MKSSEILGLLKGKKRSGTGWSALCPGHDDKIPSLSVTEEEGRVLLYCHAGCSYASIIDALGIGLGAGTGSFSHFASNGSLRNGVRKINRDAGGSTPTKRITGKRPVEEYDYTDESGRLLFQVVRSALTYSDGSIEKSFTARRRPGKGERPSADGWVYNLGDVPLVLYNLVRILDSDFVFVVEGEKDVNTLGRIGIAATCNPFGAGKWRKKFADALRGKRVAILPDNDGPGRLHAEKVAADLYGVAKEVHIIELPGLPQKGDVTDFVNLGRTGDDLLDLVKRATPWAPTKQAVESEKASGFRFTTVDELVMEPPEETSFVWDKTLPSGGFSICSAKPKVGKSTLARNLAVAVAAGNSFIDRETCAGTVLYLCLEEKRSEIRNHFERMGAVSDRILVHTGETPREPLIELATAIEEHQPVLVIIDPLSRVVRVPDFNDYGGMTRGLEPLVDLARRTGCHILALHHDSKMERAGGDALLGSTALFGAVDCHIQLRKRDGSRTVSTTQRYGEDLEETVIELDRSNGLLSATGNLQGLKNFRAKNSILTIIGADEAIEEKEIKARIEGFSSGEISRALRTLVEHGELVRSGEGKRGNPFNYAKPVFLG